MIKIFKFCLILILLLSCKQPPREKNIQIDKQNVEVEISKTKFDSIAVFDTSVFLGSEILEWRNNEIKQSFSKIYKNDEGVIIPKKTQMIDIYSYTDEISAYTLGIGRVLKTDEKKLLPDTVLTIIADILKSEKEVINSAFFDKFIVLALAEAYKISLAYDSQIDGTVFLVQIKTGADDFSVLEEYELIKSDNIYINIPLISGYFILYYRDQNGNYKIIAHGAAG